MLSGIESVWCPMNIDWTDFAVISVTFVMTLVTLFDRSITTRSGLLVHRFLLGSLALYVILMLSFPKTMETKIFAAAMLFSALVVEAAMWKRHGPTPTR